uniref:Uncharacterized protein n=1 Tax=Chaetophora lobata TaxID=1249516 RepID=A0A7U1G3E7_9CHLO|nr:hypothetical protein [Chaetophora lobata]
MDRFQKKTYQDLIPRNKPFQCGPIPNWLQKILRPKLKLFQSVRMFVLDTRINLKDRRFIEVAMNALEQDSFLNTILLYYPDIEGKIDGNLKWLRETLEPVKIEFRAIQPTIYRETDRVFSILVDQARENSEACTQRTAKVSAAVAQNDGGEAIPRETLYLLRLDKRFQRVYVGDAGKHNKFALFYPTINTQTEKVDLVITCCLVGTTAKDFFPKYIVHKNLRSSFLMLQFESILTRLAPSILKKMYLLPLVKSLPGLATAKTVFKANNKDNSIVSSAQSAFRTITNLLKNEENHVVAAQMFTAVALTHYLPLLKNSSNRSLLQLLAARSLSDEKDRMGDTLEDLSEYFAMRQALKETIESSGPELLNKFIEFIEERGKRFGGKEVEVSPSMFGKTLNNLLDILEGLVFMGTIKTTSRTVQSKVYSLDKEELNKVKTIFASIKKQLPALRAHINVVSTPKAGQILGVEARTYLVKNPDGAFTIDLMRSFVELLQDLNNANFFAYLAQGDSNTSQPAKFSSKQTSPKEMSGVNRLNPTLSPDISYFDAYTRDTATSKEPLFSGQFVEDFSADTPPALVDPQNHERLLQLALLRYNNDLDKDLSMSEFEKAYPSSTRTELILMLQQSSKNLESLESVAS